MGVADLLAAFNGVAEPAYSAEKALLDYHSAGGQQFQILTFSGIDANGAAFSVKSEMLPPETNVNQAAALVAQALLAKKD